MIQILQFKGVLDAVLKILKILIYPIMVNDYAALLIGQASDSIVALT